MAKRRGATRPTALAVVQRIEQSIHVVRGQKVMLSSDLARLYGVPPGRLNEQVARNRARFPADFMFQLTRQELANLKSQFAISSWGGARSAPYAFTEQGVAMLSSVLRSPRAVAVNIEIMRALGRLRQLIATHDDLRRKIEELEKKYDEQFAVVFDAIRQLMEDPDDGEEAKPRIGYHAERGAQARAAKSRASAKARDLVP